jgi:hypothetical protein
VEVALSVEDAFRMAKSDGEVFVIGGEQSTPGHIHTTGIQLLLQGKFELA